VPLQSGVDQSAPARLVPWVTNGGPSHTALPTSDMITATLEESAAPLIYLSHSPRGETDGNGDVCRDGREGYSRESGPPCQVQPFPLYASILFAIESIRACSSAHFSLFTDSGIPR
jgi:hypothetical protein